jgi:imidazole glycerol-phosphate synthase subunit HisH
MATRVAVVDTGLCNVDSMWRALEECGAKAIVTADPSELAHCDKLVLPGVGAFPDAMDLLEATGLADAIREQVAVDDVPVLGVCLGMQLLATRGTEVRDRAGLGLIDATVERLEPVAGERIPHIGWNEVDVHRDSPLFDRVPDRSDFYFVHSFHVVCADERDVVATTPYCGDFVSVIAHGSVVGTQFHPEKSQAHGLALLRSFVESWC